MEMRSGKSAGIGEASYPSLIGSQRGLWPDIGAQSGSSSQPYRLTEGLTNILEVDLIRLG